jgi:hypothetical protein
LGNVHRSLFLKAQDGYRKLIIEELDRMLAEAKAGRRISRSINLAEPVDHTSDYDRVIMMLENEFDQYVRDRWAWSQHATTMYQNYAVGTCATVSGPACAGCAQPKSGTRLNELILGLSEEELAVLEQQSRKQGLSLEQIIVNSIIERVEGQADGGQQWKGIE